MRWAGRIALGVALLSEAGLGMAQSPLPQGTPSDEALRKLAAQLGAPPSGLSRLSPDELRFLEFLTKQAQADPNFRRDLEKLVKDDPTLVQRVKESQPELAESIRRQFKPNDPLMPPASDTKPPFVPGQTTPPGGVPNPPMPNLPKRNPAEDNREFQEMAKLWEQTFGPIDNTPAVKQALLDMLSGSPGSKPGGKPFWADWDAKSGQGANGNPSFAKWLQGLNGGTGSTKLKLPKWLGGQAKSFQAPSIGKLPTAPKMPSAGIGGFDIGLGGLAGLGSVGTAIIVVALAALLAFLVWKFAPQLGLARKRVPRPLPGLGPWPLDPRTIEDRNGLVRAFEYVSVLLCGDGARVWNHATIAEALREAVPAAAPFAGPLAKLYALARYSPHSEQLSMEAIAEARGYLCRLAEVPSP
jgi:hypothetical protein